MTGGEIALVSSITASVCGVIVVALKVAMKALSSSRSKKSDPPPVDHGPCNEAVNRLCAVVEKEVDEQRAFRLSFEKWMAAEEGYRRGLRATGEFPTPA